MSRKSMALTALGLAAVLFVATNVVSQNGLKNIRVDLTQERLYTLSPGTLKVLTELKEPISLKFFFSDKLSNEVPPIRTYALRVRELLQEYAQRSGGKIKLQIIDPEPFSDAEDQAGASGVQGVPLDQTTGRQFYFGLVGTNTIDKQAVIPFFQQDRETFLEYDVTKLIYELGTPDKPVVAVLTDMPLEYGPGGAMAAMRRQAQPYAVLAQLKSFFDVKILPASTPVIDDKVRVLVVARPQNLPESTLYAVDQYVLKGGNAIFFVDPYAESDVDPNTGMPRSDGSGAAMLPKLFDAWGIDMPPAKFVADARIAVSVASGSRKRATPYPAWLAVGEKNHDLKDVVTAQLGTINMGSVGALKAREGSGITLSPLLTSSPAGQLLAVDQLFGRPDPEKLMAAMKPEGETEILAARVTGTLKSAFSEPPAAKEGEKPADPAKHVKESVKPSNLIVVADSDLLEDRFWAETQQMLGQPVVVPFAANGDFVVNAVENLTGGVELNSLRGRAGATRPFTVVENLRRAAGAQVLAREQELTTQLRDAERQLSELQSKAKQGSSKLLSSDEQQTIERFRTEATRIRRELRDVQHALNRDIDTLATTVKALNIVAVPLLVAVAAVILAMARVRRRALRTRE